jgi:poly-gamma-glutamate synthesis protein (capsule biosynthesis protein)
MRSRPTPDFRAFAHRVIEAGADVLFGHSAHIVQGIEVWRGKPILYDAGDFVDDYAVDPVLRNDLSALFLLRVAPSAIECLELLPVRIDHCQVNRAYGPDRAWLASRLTELCAEFGTKVVDRGELLEIQLADDGLPTRSTSP